MELINEAFDKFKDMQDEVVDCLLELLRLMNEVERAVFKRDSNLQTRIRKKELTAAEISNEYDALWADYREECKRIAEPRCTEKLRKKGCVRSFSDVPMYGYIDDPEDCRGTFSMETAKKAVVEFRFTNHSSVRFMHRFTLVPSGDTWLVDAFSYGTEKEGVWHRGHI
ncbi:MAG: RhsIA family immunity protein [Oscillospiraceae bacterium]|nr:RhsIA family immunity protein [Oscillospiraceae bacterium]